MSNSNETTLSSIKEKLALYTFIVANYNEVLSSLKTNELEQLQSKIFYENLIISLLDELLAGKKYLEFKITLLPVFPLSEEFCSKLYGYLNYDQIIKRNKTPLKDSRDYYRYKVLIILSEIFKGWSLRATLDAFAYLNI